MWSQDAHEFLYTLLRGLNASLVPSTMSHIREADKDTTAVNHLFQLVTASQVLTDSIRHCVLTSLSGQLLCPKCNYSNASFETFAQGGISLEITAVPSLVVGEGGTDTAVGY